MTDDGSARSRRQVLQALGAGSLAGLAGCEHGGTPTPSPTDSPTPSPTPTDSPTPTPIPCPDAEYVLNTGYDQNAGSTIAPCNQDDDWEITAEDVSAGPVPRPADVVDPDSAWASPFPDSKWISVECDADPGVSFDEEHFEYTYCFCLNEEFEEPRLDAEMRADDAIEDVRLNGNSLPFSGTGSYAGTPVEVTAVEREFFEVGENCLTVVVRDTGSIVTGLNLAGTVTAVDGECCEGTCDLGVEKTHKDDFVFGGTGTYVVEVCNEGDGVCEEAVEVEDDLPDAVSFDSASGSGWSVSAGGSTLTLSHANSGGLAPGECLPPVELTVQIPPAEEFPPEGDVGNCAKLVTGGANATNDVDCTTPCVEGGQTFEAGVEDQYDQSNTEPASPSDGLVAAAGGNLKDFDDPATNTWFGHTFDDLSPAPAAGRICDADLEICLRPEGGLDENDRINLGVWDDGGNQLQTHWTRALGDQDGVDGLFDRQWDTPEGEEPRESCITLDLGALPNADGSTTSLLPELNTYDRLSIKVQDDTNVDFATLTVEYCCDGDGGGECQLGVEKSVADEFQFGDTGTYAIEVCNDGEGTCDGPVTVTDRLPNGLNFVGAAGAGWQCTVSGGDVVCEHPNTGGLSPGDCLPTLTVEAEVPPADEWEGGDVVRNCVELVHGGTLVDETCISHPIGGGSEGCNLTVEKTVQNAFEFDGTGVYALEVCNEGTEPCRAEVVEIVDDLPEGFTYAGGAGTGWSCDVVDAASQTVACKYSGVSLQPGECLPVVELKVEVVPEGEWPQEDTTVQNCATLSTQAGQADEDCIEHSVQ